MSQRINISAIPKRKSPIMNIFRPVPAVWQQTIQGKDSICILLKAARGLPLKLEACQALFLKVLIPLTIVGPKKRYVAGVNLPIARGTSLSTLKEVKYAQTGKAVLGVEIYYRGGLFENSTGGDEATRRAGNYRGDYTTVYITPSGDGDVTLNDAAAVTTTSAISKGDGTEVLPAGATTWGRREDRHRRRRGRQPRPRQREGE